MDIENYQRLGLDKRLDLMEDVNGRSNRELIDALTR